MTNEVHNNSKLYKAYLKEKERAQKILDIPESYAISVPNPKLFKKIFGATDDAFKKLYETYRKCFLQQCESYVKEHPKSKYSILKSLNDKKIYFYDVTENRLVASMSTGDAGQ